MNIAYGGKIAIRAADGTGEERELLDALRSGWVTQGPRVAEFEKRFAAVVEAEHAVALSSCTTALFLALHSLGIGPGDEVIVPSLTFIASVNPIVHVGAVPVLVDTSTTEGSDDAWTVNRSQVSGTPAGICGVVGDFQATGAQVLIDGDPFSDPGALRNVWAVYQSGRRVR